MDFGFKIFTKNGCGTCKSVKALLHSKGVLFDEIDVMTDEGLQLAQDLGIMHAGTVIDADNNIIPFEKLSEVIASKVKAMAM